LNYILTVYEPTLCDTCIKSALIVQNYFVTHLFFLPPLNRKIMPSGTPQRRAATPRVHRPRCKLYVLRDKERKRKRGDRDRGLTKEEPGGSLRRTRRRRAEKRGRFLGEVSCGDRPDGRPVVCSSLSWIFDIPRVSSNTVPRRLAACNKQRHRPPLPMRRSHTSRGVYVGRNSILSCLPQEDTPYRPR